jgi:hypothetical protein
MVIGGRMTTEKLKEILAHVKEQMQEVKYGKITIELRDSSNCVDVITEIRNRFEKN